MTLLASASSPILARLTERLRAIPGAAYWGAVALVAASLGVRLLLSPILADGYGFTVFYPAVILAAYWLGGRPALLATAISAAIVYTFMGPTPLSLHMEGRTAVSLSVFLISSS